jgi:tetratricopeptide (TPR) repeat protein
MEWMKTLIRIKAILLVLIFFAVVPAAAAFKYVEVGHEAPEFTLTDLSGQPVSLSEKVGTKSLALVFWATWSPRSETMLKDLNKLYGKYKEQGFEVITVNVEHEAFTAEDRAAIEKMAAQWDFPVLLDEGLATYYLYGTVATPSLALIDEAGVVRYVRASYSTSAQLDIQNAVEQMLGIETEVEQVSKIKKRDYVPVKEATRYYQKAQILIKRGMGRKAVRDLERAAKADPNWMDPRLSLARIYLDQADKKPKMLDKAEVVLREAREIQPDHLFTLAGLAAVLVRLKRPEDALEVAEEALTIQDDFPPAMQAKTQALRALGRLDEAQALIDGALEMNPQSARLHREKGEVLAAAGQMQQAAASLRTAAEMALAAGNE